MKRIELKYFSKDELKTKLILLKSSQLFDEKTLKMIEIACLNKMSLELNENQVEFMKDIQMLQEIDHEQEYKNISPSLISDMEHKRKGIAPMEATGKTKRDNISLGSVEEKKTNEEISEGYNDDVKQQEQINVNIEIGVTESIEEKDSEQIDANVEIDVAENEDEKTEEQIDAVEVQGFIPEPDKLKDMPVEEAKKMYYLTPERVLESFKRINGGSIWEKLGKQEGLQQAIERAYKSCNWISDLMDPNFLDERLGQSTSQENQVMNMKNLHMAALLGTYVGYHVEKNDSDLSNSETNEPEKSSIAVIKMPNLVSEIPESLKEHIRDDLGNMLVHRIEEMMNTSDSYDALMSLVPLEDRIDEELEDYSEILHNTENNKVVKAYIKTIRKDLVDEMGQSLEDLNVALDLYGVDWNDSKQRRDVIGIIRQVQGSARGINISGFIQEINMSFSVNSKNDIAAVRAACEDLSQLSEYGINVNLAFNLSSKAMMDIELQQELNEIVDEYSNISRDKGTELPENMLNHIVDKGISTVANSINTDPKQCAINQLTQSAIAMRQILEHTIDGPEIKRNPLGGSGT